MDQYSKPLGLKVNWSQTEESGESGQIISASNVTLICRADTSPKRSIMGLYTIFGVVYHSWGCIPFVGVVYHFWGLYIILTCCILICLVYMVVSCTMGVLLLSYVYYVRIAVYVLIAVYVRIAVVL
jgi:hypothetical protein